MRIEMATLESEEAQKLLSVITPRPIVLISTVGEDGTYNAAPYSAVTSVCHKPPIICVSFGLRRGQKKHTQQNIEYSRDFVLNIMDETLIQPTIQTSADYPDGVDEIKEVGLTAVPADMVKSPRIAEAKASLECKLIRKLEFGKGKDLRTLIFGEVLLAYIKDELLVGDKIDPSRLRAVGRITTELYCLTKDIFEMKATKPDLPNRD